MKKPKLYFQERTWFQAQKDLKILARFWAQQCKLEDQETKVEAALRLEIQEEMDPFIVFIIRGRENVIFAKEWWKEVKWHQHISEWSTALLATMCTFQPHRRRNSCGSSTCWSVFTPREDSNMLVQLFQWRIDGRTPKARSTPWL